MAGPGRNDPCPCGSGRKVKRCCGEHPGPGEDDLARPISLTKHATPPASCDTSMTKSCASCSTTCSSSPNSISR